jgi:hypothetical protein
MYDKIVRVRSWILEYLVIVKYNENSYFINYFSYSLTIIIIN